MHQLFANNQSASVTSNFLENSVQTSTYGKVIPILYGQSRIAGNIIWAEDIKQVVTNSGRSSGKGGGSFSANGGSSTSYSYFATFAVAICEGEIDEIIRIWADAKIIEPNQGEIRIYKGSENQQPDAFIESIQGVGKTPAYRGLAYVVFEDFPLAAYGNRIPNFTFEVKRNFIALNDNEQPVEEKISAISFIPGAGEYVYDDKVQSKVSGQLINGNWVQQGNVETINQNNRTNQCDAKLAISQLKNTLPNINWVSVIVSWFADSIDAGTCSIAPAVEFKDEVNIEPDSWHVAGFNRATARFISFDENNRPNYGGTPNDASLLRYLQDLKSQGYSVMFYPMLFVDAPNKPWRGRITGTPSQVANFFTKNDGYNRFVEHYANLVKDDVDAIVIGSEFIGLTSVKDIDNSFPAVDELVSLASGVKQTVGNDVKVTYAADWSEYHHTLNGWYNLDPLWASPNIDFVGIDAYFPLSDSPQASPSKQDLIDGWESSEGYDWIYTDENRDTKVNIEPKYAWKNLKWWWENNHINPDSTQTPWTPMSKKIWFTEYGFPSVDGAANQPNVFYDPNSLESNFPRFSKGQVDFVAQRTAIDATESKWKNSNMVERMFLWTWDARPFPFWPELTNIWSDGNLWQTGHWVQGKLGTSNLSAIVNNLCQRSGLDANQIDTTSLDNLVDGYVISSQTTIRKIIDNLRLAYFFDGIESNSKLVFSKRDKSEISIEINSDDLIFLENNSEKLSITRNQEIETPNKLDVVFINKINSYQVGNQHTIRNQNINFNNRTINLPIVLTDQNAKNIADILLYHLWLERNNYQFNLPVKYSYLEPSDVVNVFVNNQTHTIRITEIDFAKPGILQIKGVSEQLNSYDFYNDFGNLNNQLEVFQDIATSKLEILDLPLLPNDSSENGYLRFAISNMGKNWQGASLFTSDDAGDNYSSIATTDQACTLGTVANALPKGVIGVFDDKSQIEVLLLGDKTLEAKSQMSVLNGANLAIIGNEIIQFKNAELLAPQKYKLSSLLRGRFGTEHHIESHLSGERFILLDDSLIKQSIANDLIGLQRLYKSATIGQNLSDVDDLGFTFNANALVPYSVVHVQSSRNVNGDIEISWIRRTRQSGQWLDYVDVPLNETSQTYEIDVYNQQDEVIKTILNVNKTNIIYSQIDQINDFGVIQTSLKISIYQISAIKGRGVKKIATI